MREPGGVRGGDGLGRLGDEGGRPGRVQWPITEHVGERLAGDPFHDDVGTVTRVVDIEHLRQARVVHPARRARGRDRLPDAGEGVREHQDRDRARQDFVDGLPQRPATARVDLVFEAVAAC